MRLRVSTTRVLVVLAVISYVTAFNVTYRDLISPIFNFWGLGYRPISAVHFWTTATLCVVPSLWMPLSFDRPSMLLYYMQYFLIFVPTSFVTFHSIRPYLRPEDSMCIVWLMFGSLSIIQAIYFLPVRPLRYIRLTSNTFWLLFWAVGLVLLGYIIARLAGNFQLANFTEIYSVRFAMADIIAGTGSRFGLYAQFLLLSVFLPIIFAVGAFCRRSWIVAVAAIGYVFLFGVGGAKAAILAIVYLPLIYALLRRKRQRVLLTFIVGITAALLSGYLANALLSRQLGVSYLGVVHFRLFTVPALTVPQYAGFFESHPVTHLATVTGFSWVLPNPYETDIPYTIGRYYYGSSVGANAGMWAADGIAGFGLWGIPLISCVCAIVLWLLDTIAADMDPAFVGVVIAYCGISFTNISLFTTLITGGLAFVMIALAFAPRDTRGRIPLPSMALFRYLAAVPIH